MSEIDANTLIALFACKLKAPLVVRNARPLCFIFHTLSEELLIKPLLAGCHGKARLLHIAQRQADQPQYAVKRNLLRGHIGHSQYE